MTNPDREELVNLADRLAALPTFKLEIVTTVPGVALNAAERDLIVTALRRLAEAGTQEAVKGACHRIALEHFDYYSEKHRAAVMAGNNAVYQAMSIGMSASEKIAKAIDALETSAPPAPSAAVPAIYICYDGFGDCFISRERPERHVAIVYDEDLAEEIVDYLNHTAPPADAGMRPTTEDILERINTELSTMAEPWVGAFSGLSDGDDVAEYLTGTVWENLATAIDALTAPGATTKSDGAASGDTDTCIACDIPLVDGDMVYSDAGGGCIHAACCGPER